MKNIHVLPTDKPSRLYLTKEGFYFLLPNIKGNDVKFQNIYITNDEEIKDGDYGILGESVLSYRQMHKRWGMPQGKKIILTTDPDLIKDGVQAIDDEFLEWFVKNPSCEFVKVYYRCDKSDCYLKEWDNCCKEAKPVLTLFAENESKAKYFREQEIIIPKEEPKQETLEEFSKRRFNEEKLNTYTPYNIEDAIIEGAKWQQQQNKNLYSEEEVLRILSKFRELRLIEFQEWFKQFKKQ